MKLPKNIILRVFLVVSLNVLIFISLVYGSIFFQFIFLGWGASANAPDFNADLTSIGQMTILAIMAYKRKSMELFISLFSIIIIYIFLKYWVGLI